MLFNLLYLVGTGFEPAHPKIPGPKPDALDHSATQPDIILFIIWLTVYIYIMNISRIGLVGYDICLTRRGSRVQTSDPVLLYIICADVGIAVIGCFFFYPCKKFFYPCKNFFILAKIFYPCKNFFILAKILSLQYFFFFIIYYNQWYLIVRCIPSIRAMVSSKCIYFFHNIL